MRRGAIQQDAVQQRVMTCDFGYCGGMSTPEDQELDDVQHKIDEARNQAVEHGTIEAPKHEQRFYESGDAESESEDDQNAAPA